MPLSAGPEHDLSKTLMHQLPEEKFWEEMKVRYGENQNMVSVLVCCDLPCCLGGISCACA